MNPCSLFYSWQSDLPNATNRGLIQTCLEKVAKELSADPELKIEPQIERDTQGVPGSPDIAATIFEKIDRAEIVLCDISLINFSADSGSRPTPNPNVLIELGYAIHRLGWTRTILVFNNAFGPIEQLPFDLRHRRVLQYTSHQGDSTRKDARGDLQKALSGAIRPILQHLETASLPPPNPVDDLIPILEDARPNAELTGC